MYSSVCYPRDLCPEGWCREGEWEVEIRIRRFLKQNYQRQAKELLRLEFDVVQFDGVDQVVEGFEREWISPHR
jgi:hypothetical protein